MSSSKSAPERQQRVGPGRAVVPEDRLAPPEPPVDPDGVLHLRHRDARDPHDVEQGPDAPPDAEGEPAAVRRCIVVPHAAVTSGWRVGVFVTPVAIPTSSLTAAAAPQSVAASFTLKRSDRNTEPSPMRSASRTSSSRSRGSSTCPARP